MLNFSPTIKFGMHIKKNMYLGIKLRFSEGKISPIGHKHSHIWDTTNFWNCKTSPVEHQLSCIIPLCSLGHRGMIQLSWCSTGEVEEEHHKGLGTSQRIRKRTSQRIRGRIKRNITKD